MPPLQSPTHSIHDGHTDLLWAINIATMQLQMCCYSQISSQEFALKTKYVICQQARHKMEAKAVSPNSCFCHFRVLQLSERLDPSL